MLVTGWTQAAVMRWLNNIYGENAFNPNNLSTHTNNHLTIHDASMRDIIEAKARMMATAVDENTKSILTRDAAVEATIKHTYDLMMEGKITPEVRDMIKAVEVMTKIEQERSDTSAMEMERDMRAFMIAVKKNAPEEMWDAIYQDFLAELDRRPVAFLPAELDEIEPHIEGEVIDE